MGKFHVDIAGLRHHISVSDAAELNRLITSGHKIKLTFTREPENEADSNAIVVFVASNVEDIGKLGYVRAGTAKVLAGPFDKQNKTLVGYLDEVNVEHMWARALVKIVKVKKPAKTNS